MARFVARDSLILLGLLGITNTVANAQLPRDSRIPQDFFQSLCKLESIDGSAVGYAGMPGDFYLLSEEFLKRGTQKDYAALIDDKLPIVRAMGLVCLTRTDKDAAKRELKKRLESQAEYECFPGGCVGTTITEGQFAWELLHDANYLIMGEEKKWLTEAQLFELDIDVLSRDACWEYHFEVKSLASTVERTKEQLLVLPKLRELAPTLSDFTIVKGLGRLQPATATRSLLMSCVLDQELSNPARLAAASALTRDTDPSVSVFLPKHEDDICKLAPGLEQRFFTKRQQDRVRFLDNCAKNQQVERAFSDRDETDDNVSEVAWELRRKESYTRAYLSDAPFTIDGLVSAFWTSYMDDYPAMAKDFAHHFVRSVSRLDEVAYCWDTDSDCVLRAEDALKYATEFLQKHMSQEELSLAKAKVVEAKQQLHQNCTSIR